MCGWQVKLCDPIVTRAISERFTDKGLIIKRYENSAVYFTYLLTLHGQKCPPMHYEGVYFVGSKGVFCQANSAWSSLLG